MTTRSCFEISPTSWVGSGRSSGGSRSTSPPGDSSCRAAPDALVYYLVWFLRGRYEHGQALVDSFPNFATWEARVDALGHGHATDLGSREALEIARAATPGLIGDVDPNDPQPLEAGQHVAVSSIADDGTDPATGTLATLARDEIVLRHEAPEVGEVAVHFPRGGYRVEAT